MLTNWILSLMLALQPVAPWLSTYTDTADAIATVATDEPIFTGEQGVERTAALLVVMAFRESSFNPAVTGDHGAAKGLFQVHGATLGRPVEDDAEGQARGAVELLRTSFRVCAKRPLAERLGWYAAGRAGCDRRLELSRWRMRETARLLREHPLS